MCAPIRTPFCGKCQCIHRCDLEPEALRQKTRVLRCRWPLRCFYRGAFGEFCTRYARRPPAFVTTCTTLNVQRIISGKRPSPIVTLQAAVCSSGSMFEDGDIGDLSALRGPLDHVMTLPAIYPPVVSMSENGLEGIIRLQSAAIRREGMADGA